MRLLILYHSQTGNTEFACTVARMTAESAGHDVTMMSFADAEAKGLELEEYDAFCFATAVQAWQPVKNVERFLKGMKPLRNKAAFLISTTAGMPGETHAMMASWLEPKGIKVLEGFDLITPDSWPTSRRLSRGMDRRIPTEASIRKLVAFTKRMLSLLSAHVEGKAVTFPTWRVRRTPYYFLAMGERQLMGRSNLAMGKKIVDESACTKCGICMKKCPADAIRMEPFPVFSSDCDACWRCINVCPEDCITCRLDSRHHYKGLPERSALIETARRIIGPGA